MNPNTMPIIDYIVGCNTKCTLLTPHDLVWSQTLGLGWNKVGLVGETNLEMTPTWGDDEPVIEFEWI